MFFLITALFFQNSQYNCCRRYWRKTVSLKQQTCILSPFVALEVQGLCLSGNGMSPSDHIGTQMLSCRPSTFLASTCSLAPDKTFMMLCRVRRCPHIVILQPSHD